MKLSTYFQAFLFIATGSSLQRLALAKEESSAAASNILSNDASDDDLQHAYLDFSATSDEFLSKTGASSLRGNTATKPSVRGTPADGRSMPNREPAASPMILVGMKSDHNGNKEWSSSSSSSVADDKVMDRKLSSPGKIGCKTTWPPEPRHCSTDKAPVLCWGACLYLNMCYARAAGDNDRNCHKVDPIQYHRGPFN
jgi:hypothetical protein